MLSEISQQRKTNTILFQLYLESKKKKNKQTNQHKTETKINIENKLMVARR